MKEKITSFADPEFGLVRKSWKQKSNFTDFYLAIFVLSILVNSLFYMADYLDGVWLMQIPILISYGLMIRENIKHKKDKNEK